MFYCFSEGCPAELSAYDREITGKGKHSSTEQWTLDGSYNMLSRAYTFQGERNQNENGRNTRGATTGMEAISVRSGRVSRVIASIITGDGWFFVICLFAFLSYGTNPHKASLREGEQEIAGGLFNNNSHWGGKRMFVCNYIPVTTLLK